MPSAKAKLPNLKHKVFDREPCLSDVWLSSSSSLRAFLCVCVFVA